MPPRQVLGDTVVKYLEKYPDTPTRTLASLIYKENVAVFKDIEHARYIIRYHRGKAGTRDRGRLSDKRFVDKTTRSTNPFDSLPEGLKQYDDWSPYRMSAKRTLVMADQQIPYHDKEIIEKTIKFGSDQECDGVLILGDMSDFYAISFFERDPRLVNWQEEIDITNAFLTMVREIFPKAEIVLKVGNHEERLERYFKIKAPELVGWEATEYKNIFKADEHGMEIVKDKRLVRIAGLNCIHGHEFGRSVFSPVNPARGIYLRGKENALCAHYHQTSQHSEKSMNDHVTSCWSIGCQCDLKPLWMPINKWNHGFAIVEQSRSAFQVNNYRIIDGEVY